MSRASARTVGFRSERGPILMSMMLSLGLIAIDATVLATAVPAIVKELGHFGQFPWLFSSYLLGQAVTTPVYGKLADMYGRRPLMLLGIAVFLIGSILCALAWNMAALIVFRAIQGIGAGGVQPMAMTIIGDIYTVAERAKVQGYLSSVWAGGSILGPTLGGAFAQLGIWRGIFLINIPLCFIAVWMLMRHYRESFEHHRPKVDYLGATLLMAAMTAVILAILNGGHTWPWNSKASIAAFSLGALLLICFVAVERRAPHPILPLWVFSQRLLVTTTIVALGVGAIVMGLTSYVPTYLAGSLAVKPVFAGLTVAMLTIGWQATAIVAGFFYLRWGFKKTAAGGIALALIGLSTLVAVADNPQIVKIAAVCFLIGGGLGLVSPPSLIAAQSSVDWDKRGAVTGTNIFARALGSAVGVAVFGAVGNAVFGPGDVHSLSPALIETGSRAVFIGVLVAAVVTALAIAAMPGHPNLDHNTTSVITR